MFHPPRSAVFLLCVLFAIGLFLRVYELGALSLSEDESHKIAAVQSYKDGDITANAEHPMLMKVLMALSVSSSHWWNQHSTWKISEEAALRFPNALFGAATTIPLYYLTASFFGPEIGLLSAAFWATGINAVSTNRIGKEDTLLVFFMLPAFYFYRKAKMLGLRDIPTAKRLFTWSGAMFGLQIASKYLPGYIGMNALFYYMLKNKRQNQPMPGNSLKVFFSTMLIVFFVANVALLFPGVWVYISQYMREKLLAHHGYQMMGVLYYNTFSKSFRGTPFYYYLLYLVVKSSIPLLILFIVGLAHAYQHKPGTPRFFLRFLFFWWMVPYSLLTGKWIRYVLPYLPFFYMTAAVGFAVLLREIRQRTNSQFAERVSWICGIILVIGLAIQTFVSLPAPSLFVNGIGGGRNKIAYYYPQDEFYDAGLREAYEYLAHHAKKNSVVATDAVAVFDYYSQRVGRPDLIRTPLIKSEHRYIPQETVYVLVHEGNRYFENDSIFQYLKDTQVPIYVIRVGGFDAVRIYQLSANDFLQAEKL